MTAMQKLLPGEVFSGLNANDPCFNSFKIIFVCFFHLFLSLFIYWIFILIYNYCENQCLAFKDHT